jgi:hypothetical protein
MATLCISYDLNQAGKNYDGLITKIREVFPTYWHHLDSMWLVVTDMTPVAVRDLLKPYLDSDDELLVAKISAPAAWTGFNDRGSKWLKDNLN